MQQIPVVCYPARPQRKRLPFCVRLVEIQRYIPFGRAMPELLKYQVARVLDQLLRFSSPSRRHINRCMTLLRPFLLSAEISEEDVDRFVHRVYMALAEGEVLMRLNCGPEVRRTIELALEKELGLSIANDAADWLPTRMAIDSLSGKKEPSERKWCLKEFQNHARKAPKRSSRPRSMDHFDRRLPRGEELPAVNPFTTRTPQVSDDKHAKDLDREAMDRLLRQLGLGGPDFGPEPPFGGSPARL